MEAKRELAVECMLYMDMKDGETKDEALTRMVNILDKAKLEWVICECEERRVIIAKKKDHLECRIRYVEDWCGQGEHFVFENKWTNEDEWGLDTAFKLLDYNGIEGEVVSYQAITKIRDLMSLGIPFRFGK